MVFWHAAFSTLFSEFSWCALLRCAVNISHPQRHSQCWFWFDDAFSKITEREYRQELPLVESVHFHRQNFRWEYTNQTAIIWGIRSKQEQLWLARKVS
jgi:hypothetical protein